MLMDLSKLGHHTQGIVTEAHEPVKLISMGYFANHWKVLPFEKSPFNKYILHHCCTIDNYHVFISDTRIKSLTVPVY